MATETELPESVYLKKDEGEDNVLSEILEEKVTEHGNKVKQLESGSQPLETSSHMAETVNTLETGKPTNESETFIQTLSVPMVTSNTLESCEATSTEDQEESKTTKIEDFKEGKPNVDEQVKAVSILTEPEDKYDEKAIEKKASEGIGPDMAESELRLKLSESMASSKKEVLNSMLEKDQGHNDDVISSQDASCGDQKETTTAEHATKMADFKEHDPSEKPREFLKEEIDDKLTDAPEACEQSQNETNENREEKPDESVKKSEEDEDNEEIRLDVQIEEKMEQNELPHNITTDGCISTQTTSEMKVTEHDEKNEEAAGKSDSPSIKEVCEETGEKVEYQEQAVNLLEKVKDIETEQEVIMLKKDQGKDEVINVKDETFEEGFEEKIQQSEDKDHEIVKAKESIEEDTEEVRTVETPEKAEQQRLINVLPTDVCIATQIEPEEKVTENEERNDERANENDDGQMKKPEKAESEEGLKLSDSSTITPKENETASQDEDQQKEQELYMSEKGQTLSLAEEHEEEVIEIKDGQKENCDNLLIKEAFKETDSEKVEFESVEVSDSSSIELKEKAVAILSKDEAEEKEQELNMSEKGQEEDVVKCSQAATLKTEKSEQQELLHAITTDDRISSQADLQEKVIKNEEEAIEAEVKVIHSDGEQKENSDNLFVKEVCQETDLKKTEAEGIKISDSSNMLVSSKDATPEKDLQEKSYYNEGNKIPEVLPKSEDMAIATHVDEEKRTATKETSSDQESEKLYISTEENVAQLEKIAENNSPNGERDTEENVTQEDQLNSTEDCSEMVKDVILSKEIEQASSEIQKEHEKTVLEEQVVDKESYSQNQKEMAHEISYPDPIPVGKPEMTEVKVNDLIGQDLQVAEGISCESKVKNDSVDQAPKEEQIPSLEDAATVEPEVDLSKIESTTYPSESEKLPIQAIEPVCNVQTSEVITESEDSKVKEERFVLETVGHTDENKVEEEQIIRTHEISSAPDAEEENERSSFLQNTEEAQTPEHSDISENIMNEQSLESKLEHMKEKKLEDVKMDLEEDVTQAPENQIKVTEEKNEKEKNVILTDQVVVEPTKKNERIEVEGQVSEEDSSTTKLDTTSTSNQMESTNEIEYSKPIPVRNTEGIERKAESHLELGNIPAAEDLNCLSKASSTLEASNTERDDGTEKSITTIREVKDDSVDETSKDEVVPVVEDITELELEANLPEIKSADIPSDSQDSMKLTEGIPCSTQETIKVKDDELVSEVETYEASVKMGIQEEHPETTNDKRDTPTAGVSSEKLLDEPEKLDSKDDAEEIAEGDKKALEESYQDAVAGVMGHEHFSQTEELKELTEKLESVIPSEEPTPLTDEDQTNELTLETDKIKVEHGSLSNKDKNPELEEEELAKPFSEEVHAITTDDRISSQADLQEKVIKNEEEAIEAEVKVIHSDGEQKENSDNLFVKEVCQENLKKTEAEGIKISDSSNMLVSSKDATPEKDLQEKSYYNEGNKTEIVETRENAGEIESSVKTEEETEQQKLLHVITTDSCSSTQTEVPAESFEMEEENEEATDNDDGQMKLESMEKEQELKMLEVQGGGDDLKTSQKEGEKKEEIGQEATTVEAGDFGETTKAIIKDEAEAIDVQEANMNEDGENEEREQMPEGIVNKTLQSCSEIEQDQHTKEIIPSVESNAEEDVFMSTQTESPEEATKNDKKATETDSDRKEKSDNPLVKEVCDETNLEKSECEKQIEFPESSSLNLNEKSIPVVTKDEDQKKEQELKDETAVYEENLQEKSYDGEGNKDKIVEAGESIKKDIEEQELEREKEYQNECNESEFVETAGCVDDDTQEIKSSVETKEYADTVENKESKDEDAIENDDDRTKKSESPLVKEVCEATSSDKAESEETVKLSDSFTTILDENEMSKEENLEQEQETEILEIRGDDHDVISSQNASNEETKENTIGQHATIMAYFEEGQCVSAKTEKIIKEEAEDESIDAQKASKQCENDANDKAGQNPEEGVNKSANSSSEIVEGNVEEDEGTNNEIEAELDADNRIVNGSEMKDEVVSTEKMPLEVGQSKEQFVEDIQICPTESLSEKIEDDITKRNEHLSYDEIKDKDANTNTEDRTFLDGRPREIEVSTLEHASVEEKNGDLDEVSKENFTDLKETTTVEPQEDSTPSSSLETSTKDNSNLEKVKAENENLPKDDLDSGSEIQIPEVLPMSEEAKLKEEHLNSETIMHEDEEKGTIMKDSSSDEKQATEILQETFEEVCEETSSEKDELKERLKLSDSSNTEINEKAVTFSDEDQEKDRDVNISIEDQGKDNVTSLHDAVSEKENLQAGSYQNEGDEHKFLETRESVDEDTKETKPSVESKENKFETPLFKEVCETTLEKAESEDGIKHSEAYNTKPDEDEIVSKEENLEKEKELTMSEVQGDGDDVTSSNEVIKETTISQAANRVGNFEEGQDLSAVTKEIIEEEAGDQSIDAQEANKECQDGAKDKSEQNHEESVNKPVKACVEISEGHFTEDEADAGDNNVIEAKKDAENQVDGTKDRVEIEDEVVSAVKMSSELGQPKELNVEEIETCLTKTMTEKTEDEITKKENDSSHGSIEDIHAAVEPEDITPSGSLGTSTEDTSKSEKAKAESESLHIVFVSEEQIPEVLPKSEDMAIATHVDEEKRTATKEISSDQNLEPYRESKLAYLALTNNLINETTHESEKLYISTEENVAQLEKIAENKSPNRERDTEENVTQEDQLNSTEDCSEMVKDVILSKQIEQASSEIQKEHEKTDLEEQVVDKESYSQNQKEMAHEISYPDPIPVGKPEMTEVKVNDLIGQDLQVAEGISCESKVKNDSVDQAPKEEQIPSLEDAATVEPEVNLSKIESTTYPSESEKLPIQALEPVCNVQTSEVITESEDSKVKEERFVLETVGHTGENKVEEEQIIRTHEISSAPDAEEENERSSFLQNTEEEAQTPEHSDISENIMNEQTLESKLEHMKEKKLEDVKMDLEEDVTQAPENQIKVTEEKNEKEKNVILTDQVVVEPTKKNERIEVEGQVSEEDSSTTKLDTTSTSNQMESTNEIEYSKPIPVGNTEEIERKAESHLELGNIPAAEDLDCLSKASSTLEASNTERDDGTEKSITTIREVKDDSVDETSKDEVVPVVEDITELELEANLPEIKSADIPSDSQDSMKLTEGMPCSTQETIKVKDDELVSEVETHEASVKMGIQEEHPETTNDKRDTPTAGVSSEKLLDEPEKLDSKDDAEEIAEGDKKALEESYQDAVAGVMGHERFSQTKELKELTEKLESVIPSEEPTPLTDEDQTNELTLETDKTKFEHGSLSNKDKNPELEEEELAKPFSEDQSIKERYVEEEVQGKCGVEDTEEKRGNEVVEDVIVNEVLIEDETTKESVSIKDNNDNPIQNQPMSVTQEVFQTERLGSSPDELLEIKDLVEDAEKPELVAETLEIKDNTFTVMKESNEAIDIPAPEIENLESMETEEKIIEANADKQKEPLKDPQADDPAEAISGSILSSLEQDIDVRAEESRGHGDVNKPEEKPTEATEVTSEVAEIVPNDREVSVISTDGLLETFPEMLLAKHDPKLTATPEKIEDEINDKEVACKSVEKTRELQVSTLNSEIVEGKQDGPDDIQNKEKEPVQPQEQEKLVDPPSYVEIKEQEKFTHCGSQESSEESALLSQNDKKIEDSPTLQPVEKELMQGLDKGFEEAPVIEVQKNEEGLDHTTDIRTVDVVNNVECSEVEPPKLDTKKETLEFVNKENQRDQKNEVDEHNEVATPIEDAKSSTPELEVSSVMDETADKEGYNEDPEDMKAEAYEAEKGILTDNKYPESTFGISKPTEEASGMKQEPLELNAPTALGTEATEDLKISQKYVTNSSHEQAEPNEKSFTADAEDLNASKASGTEAQCVSEVTQDERKTSDEKKKPESTKGKTEVAENLNKESEPALTKDQQDETVDSPVKTDEEDNEKLGSCSDDPVMVEASKDMDVKVHKKSHNMLSGVGSKVKHSIAKVKKAITGKSFQPKPTSP